jgi:hypothetical protein
METAGPRSTVTAELMPGTLELEHLRERFYDPGAHKAPPPLEDVSAYAPEPPSLDAMRTQGGPLLEELRDAIVTALTDGTATTVGAAFNSLEPALRRPVEILGLLQIATQIDAVRTAEAAEGAGNTERSETFETVRPDGSRRTFTVPRITLTDDDTAALAALNYGSDDD